MNEFNETERKGALLDGASNHLKNAIAAIQSADAMIDAVADPAPPLVSHLPMSEAIRKEAANSGKTQEQLALDADCSQSTISAFLAGSDVMSSTLDKIAAAVQVKARRSG